VLNVSGELTYKSQVVQLHWWQLVARLLESERQGLVVRVNRAGLGLQDVAEVLHGEMPGQELAVVRRPFGERGS